MYKEERDALEEMGEIDEGDMEEFAISRQYIVPVIILYYYYYYYYYGGP